MPIRTPYYAVRMEGEDITPWVSSAVVVEDDRQADSVTLTIPDQSMIYTDALFEGCVVEVDLGYAEPNQHALMLKAVITKVELSYPETGVSSLTLKGEDKSIMMGLIEKKKRWRDQSVADIVRELGNSHGFPHIEAHLDPPPRTRRSIHQDGKTDLAFLQELAEMYHAKCFVELNEQGEEVLYFIPERRVVGLRRPDELVLRYRMGSDSNLISFAPSFDSSYIDRLKEVEGLDTQGNSVRSQDRPPSEITMWDLNEVRMAQASARDRPIIERLYSRGAECKQDLQRRLTARRPAVGEVTPDQDAVESTNETLEARRLGMSASGTTFGNIWLRAKSNVTLRGVSERFNGKWYVSNVTHKIDGSGYKSDFKCVR